MLACVASWAVISGFVLLREIAATKSSIAIGIFEGMLETIVPTLMFFSAAGILFVIHFALASDRR